jgi:hypothetical protein
MSKDFYSRRQDGSVAGRHGARLTRADTRQVAGLECSVWTT